MKTPPPPVLRIKDWSETFEKSDSRRYKSLTWISVPVTFASDGYQQLLEDFEPETAAALYGCWQALCQMAAGAPARGTLANSDGKPWRLRRYEQLSGLPAAMFSELIDWCQSKSGWLERVETTENPTNSHAQQSTNNHPTITQQPNDQPPSDTRATLHNRTLQNIKKPSSPITEPAAKTAPPPTEEEEGEISNNEKPAERKHSCRAARPASSESLPTPAPPAPHTWQTVTESLTLAGLNMAAEATQFARRNGATPEHCAAILDHWKANPNAWEIGAIYARLKNPALCNLPPADKWPKRSAPPPTIVAEDAQQKQLNQFARIDADKQRAAASREETDRLAAKYAAAIDQLPAETLLDYVPNGPARATLAKHGWRAPAIRGRILRTYAERKSQ